MIPDNAWILRITAAAGTELADPYSYSTVTSTRTNVFLYKSSLQPIGPSSRTRVCWIRVASIVQYSHCCLRRSLVRVSVPVWGTSPQDLTTVL